MTFFYTGDKVKVKDAESLKQYGIRNATMAGKPLNLNSVYTVEDFFGVHIILQDEDHKYWLHIDFFVMAVKTGFSFDISDF